MSQPPERSSSHRTAATPLSVVPAAFVFLWSTGFIGAKLGMPYAEPFTFLLVRFAVVVPLLAIAALATRAPWPHRADEIARIGLVGVLLHAAYLGGVFFAISRGLEPAVVALIVGLQPLATAGAARVYLGERLSRVAWIGLVLGFIGVVLVVGGRAGTGEVPVAGVATALVALAGITAGTLYQKRHGTRMNLFSGSAVQFIAAALALLPLALFCETGRIVWTGEFVFAVLWLAIVLSIGAISLLHLLIRRGAAAKVASLFYLTPSVTAVLAWFLFGTTLTPAAVAGFVLSAVGVALVSR
ncbi:MAG: DMT family transporter [Rhodospirillales bacterium]